MNRSTSATAAVFEGKRPSSRDTANPVQIMLSEKPGRRAKARSTFSTTVSMSARARCAAARWCPTRPVDPAGAVRRVRVIGSRPMKPFAARYRIATDQSRKIVFVVKDDNSVEASPWCLVRWTRASRDQGRAEPDDK